MKLQEENPRSNKRIWCLAVVIAGIMISWYAAFNCDNSAFVRNSVRYLDGKKDNVTALTAAVTGTSFAITALHDDIGSSVADEIDDTMGLLLVVLCALYLQKYMLLILLKTSLIIFVPCVIVSFLMYQRNPKVWIKIRSKSAILAITFAFLIPSGIFISKMIEKTYDINVEASIKELENLKEEAVNVEEDDANILDKIGDTIGGALNSIKNIPDRFANTISNCIEQVGVMIITSAVIPLLVIFVFLKIMAWALRLDINTNDLLNTHKRTGRQVGKIRRKIRAKQDTLEIPKD